MHNRSFNGHRLAVHNSCLIPQNLIHCLNIDPECTDLWLPSILHVGIYQKEYKFVQGIECHEFATL